MLKHHGGEKVKELGLYHRRSQDFSRGRGSHCVEVRVLVCLEIFKLKRHGIFATCSRLLYKKKACKRGVTGTPRPPPGCALVDDLKKNSFKSLFCLSTKALGVQDLESKASLFFRGQFICGLSCF